MPQPNFNGDLGSMLQQLFGGGGGRGGFGGVSPSSSAVPAARRQAPVFPSFPRPFQSARGRSSRPTAARSFQRPTARGRIPASPQSRSSPFGRNVSFPTSRAGAGRNRSLPQARPTARGRVAFPRSVPQLNITPSNSGAPNLNTDVRGIPSLLGGFSGKR